MKIKMTVGVSGPAITLSPGDEHDFPHAEAVRFIEAGFAVPFVEDRIERTVDAPIVETREAYDFTAPRAPGEPAPRKRKAKG